ncbi:MAG: serine protease [Paracoccaceae bacterium]|nr:serine protease [Paracoccaceae bacterium]
MNSNIKNENSPFGVRAAYIFGIVVCLCSIYLSGLDDNPMKGRENFNFKIDKGKNKLALNTVHHHLKSQNLIEIPIKNPGINVVQNTIKIPIDVRNSNGSGTAFKIGNDSWITARHVVHGCQNVYLSNEVIKNIFIPPSSDLALLLSESFNVDKFELSWFPSLNNSIKDRKDLVVGDLGYSIGFPKGEPGEARLKFAGYVQMIQRGAYYLTEPVKMWVETQRQPRSLDQMGGISGGPIFNKEGSVVGVHVANSVRRGRAFSVDEYAISWLVMAVSKKQELTRENPKIHISDKNWSEIASTWRNTGRIKKVICTI